MTMIDEDTQPALARSRLDAVANLIAHALVRLQSENDASDDNSRGLANTSEQRVYVDTFKPQRRES